jgi:hypothetical protein
MAALPAPALVVLDGQTERTTLTSTPYHVVKLTTDAWTRCGTSCGSPLEAMRQEHREEIKRSRWAC